LAEALASAEIPDDKSANNAVKKWAVACGCVGKWHAASDQQKRDLFTAISSRRGHFAYAAK
jgi:hypothetical protein